MAVTKCNYCVNEAIYRSDGLSYCRKHLPKSLKSSLKSLDEEDIDKLPKKMKIFCKLCDKKFYRTSKRGRLCESCLKKIKEESLLRVKKNRDQTKISGNVVDLRQNLRILSKIQSEKNNHIIFEKEDKDFANPANINLNETPIDMGSTSLIPERNQFDNISLDEIFEASLLNKITKIANEYKGQYSRPMSYLPKLFKLLCNLLKDRQTDWNCRIMISTALSYFVMPEDIIPDNNSEEGYLDDLFIMLFVLREISNKIDEELIVSNWDGEEDIIKLIKENYSQVQSIVGSRSSDILDLVGLRKYVLADVNYTKDSHIEKIRQLILERNELISILAFLVAKLYNNYNRFYLKQNDLRNLDGLKSLIKENENYSEIMRVIDMAKKKKISPTFTEFKYEDDKIKRELRLRRIKRLLKQ